MDIYPHSRMKEEFEGRKFFRQSAKVAVIVVLIIIVILLILAVL